MNIGIIGCGNLGTAVARLVTRNLNINDRLLVADINLKKDFQQASNTEVIKQSDILFLCSKPNDIKNIVDEINTILFHKSKNFPYDRLIVSCAAGISLDTLQTSIEYSYPLIRIMTNLPISFGKGSITYMTGNTRPTDITMRKFMEIIKGPLLLPVGNEKLLDVSTVLTGCMPAFASFLSEEMIEFGISQGLTYEQSRDLYIATVSGTMEMLKTNTSEEIIDAVSSPNGVTAKGISYLETSGIRAILSSTMYKSYLGISSLNDTKPEKKVC
jgi:pyrroline-5-carboxylate reductase